MVPVRTTCVKKPSWVKVWVRNCFSTVAMKTWLEAPRKSCKYGCLPLTALGAERCGPPRSFMAFNCVYQQCVIGIWTWLRCNRNSYEGYLIRAGRDNAVETQVCLFKLEDFLCNSSLTPSTICKYNKWNLIHLASSGGEALELMAKVTKNKKGSSHTSGLTCSETKQLLHNMLAKTADCCFR